MVWSEVLKEEMEEENEQWEHKIIFLIDDSTFMQHIIQKIFKKHHLSFKMFSSAEEALKYLKELDSSGPQSDSDSLPSLFVCDLILPGLNGIEFKQKISEHPIWQRIPFVFLSGQESMLEMEKYFDTMVLDFISKPFEEDDFIKRIKQVLI